MKKVMIIINPTSGGETALDYKESLENKAKEYFDYVETKITQKAKDATQFAEKASKEKYDAVIVFGGDGTVNEVISGIAEKNHIPKLGIIPGGTGNLITKLLEINQNIDQAIEELDFNFTKTIDVGKANLNYFGYIFSVGSLPEAIHNVDIEDKTKYGIFAYAINTMKSVVEDDVFNVRIESENGNYEGEASQVLVLLSNYYADKKLFDENKDQIAAVIVEPVAANMGLVLPEEGFLEFLREITKDHGSLLIFDEVITGFRLSLGGAQQYYNIKPDITTLGKIVGGGMPIGAYGGRREIMQMISPDGPVYQAGTLSGNPVATTAGIETLNILKNDPQIYERLEQKTRKLADAAREAGKGHICVNQIGSLMSVFFTDQKVRDFESAVTSNTEQYADYFGYLLDRGIYIAPSQFETMFISNAHTEEDIEKTCKLAGEALCSLDF